MTTCFLASDGLASWLAKIAQTRRVLAPHKEGKAVLFREWKEGDPAPELAKSTISPKGAIIPACETLVKYQITKDPENLSKRSLALAAPTEATPTVLFGCRACDARGLVALDTPYLKGKFKDPYYAARREATLIVTRTCDSPTHTCFCTWVGGGPASPEGSDVLMTTVDGGYVLESVTDKGEAFLKESGLPDGADKMDEARKTRTEAAKKVPARPDLSKAPERLKARFNDMAFWVAQTSKCLSCGACTYMCPTCQCFNISDEGDASSEQGGRRLRSWDYCMSPMFTREASGHNPRMAKAQRMRNRVSHKYWYSTETIEDGRFSCTGCGRCVAQCPVSLDLREIVQKAIEE